MIGFIVGFLAGGIGGAAAVGWLWWRTSRESAALRLRLLRRQVDRIGS